MEESIQFISISDLLRRSFPLTGAASLQTPPSLPPLKKRKTQNPNETLTLNHMPNPRSFSSITHPVLLAGTVDLHSPDDPDLDNACRSHCLSFSDASTKVCCAVLDLDPGIFGAMIEVTAWNFLPLSHKKSGFLEIIKWRFSGTASVHCCSPHPNAIVGRLRSVSPIFSLPCKNLKSVGDSVGFLAEIMTCECELCKSYGNVEVSLWQRKQHSFEKSNFVYFLKPASKWRPVVNKLVGKLVVVSGLKKKMILVGDMSYKMFVTTENITVALCPLTLEVVQVGRRADDDEGIYSGVVTGVYMNGMVIELDGKVWLLITDPTVAPQHSLRVGAIISVRNFHLVHPKFSWIKMLLLGTCVRTSIDIKFFSLSDSRSYVRSRTQSTLVKFIGSLTLPVKFWVVLLVSCFRRKFANILSDKGILGSKNREGLAQVYASAFLDSDDFKSQQNGVFMDFCKHNSCTCNKESNLTYLRLVTPISNLITKCEAMWVSLNSKTRDDDETVMGDDYAYQYTRETTSIPPYVRKVISSKDLGFILVGSLKIWSSSGRLQLVDDTGSIDVVVPDLLSSDINAYSIYEVQNYNLVMEGSPMHLDSMKFHSSEALSCKNIFEKFPLKRVFHELVVYVHFYLKDSTCLNGSFGLPSDCDRNDPLSKITGEITHMLLVTHKFPAAKNFQGNPTISRNSSLYAEAILLPYKLMLSEDNSCNQDTEAFIDKLHSHSNYGRSHKSPKRAWLKRENVLGVCSREKVDIADSNYEQAKSSLSKIPCLITLKSAKNQGHPVPGYLRRTEGQSQGNTTKNQCGKRILLEFSFDSFCKYQVLQLGGYYMVKFSNGGLPSVAMGNDSLISDKICITSETTLWALSFSFDDIKHPKEPSSSHSSGISSVRVSEAHLEHMCQDDVVFRESLSQVHTHSDIHVHLSSESMFSLTTTTKATEKDGFIMFLSSPGEVLSVSSCIQIMKAEVPTSLGATVPQSCCLPQGSLISLCGNIEKIHTYDCKPRSYTSSHHTEFPNNDTRNVCKIVIHLFDGQHMVQICDNLNTYAYPIGMGPGANATFYRVLVTCSPSGCPTLLLTPVSFIVINSIRATGLQLSQKSCTPQSGIQTLILNSLGMISLGLISQLTPDIGSKLVRLHCRVVMVLHLVLEEHSHEPAKSHSMRQLKLPGFTIPIAGFLLDDGSSLCCCWANAESAEMMLKLHGTAEKEFLNGRISSRSAGGKSYQLTVGYHLEKMLKRYHKVTMKNHRVAPDPSSLGFAFTVDSDEIFSHSDERLLRFIILNASAGPAFNVVGNVMDSNALMMLDTLLNRLDTDMRPMQNFWITEVGYLDPLKEARNILDELTR